jgi:PAS domain S-box-containing protein
VNRTSLTKLQPLIWLAVAFVLVSGIVFSAYLSHKSYRTVLMKNFNLQQKLVVTSIGDLVRDHLDEARQNLQFIAKEFGMGDRDPHDLISSVYQTHQDDFLGISLVDGRGKKIASTPEGISVGQEADSIRDIIREGGGELGPFMREMVDPSHNEVSVRLYVPFVHPEEKSLYFIVGQIRIEEFMRAHLPEREGRGMCFILTNAEGNLLTLFDSRHRMSHKMLGGNVFSPGAACLQCHGADEFSDLRRAARGDTVVHAIYRHPDGMTTNRISLPLTLLNTKWTVSICSPYEDIQASIAGHLRKTTLLSVLLLLVLVSVGGVAFVSQKRRAVLEVEKNSLLELAATSEELQKSEARFRTIVENANAVIFMTDGDGVFLLSEGKGLSAMGLKPGEVVGLSALEVYRDYPAVVKGIKAALDGNLFRDIIEVQGVFFDIFYSPFHDSRGCVVGLIGMALDITESMEAQADLRESEEKYRSLFEESKDSIVVTTPAGKIVEANQAAVELLGYDDKEELYRLDLRRDVYADPRDRDRFQSLIAEKGVAENFEVVLKRKDGGRVTGLMTGSTVLDDAGKDIFYHVTVRDVTEQRRLQSQLAQSQKMESVGTLAGGIAHDFNNILGAIMGYSELTLSDMPKGSEGWENMSEVVKATYRAKNIVKQILTFSRKAEESISLMAVPGVVSEVLKFLRASMPATIEIREEIDPDSGQIMGDQNQMHQVVMNLCTNAHHAMREEGGILEVKLDRIVVDQNSAAVPLGLAKGSYVRLSVSDTGIGMDAATKERIFEPYFTTKGKDEGTGLGMAVVHGIVKGHGGTIAVESTRGKGSTFTIYLPRIEAAEGRERAEGSLPPRGTEKVLFVDDEGPLARLGQKMLEKLGYRVDVTTSSADALERVRSDPKGWDLVITDQTMAGLTGSKLAAEILSIRPDLPIIICTGYSDVMDKAKAEKIGVKDYLMKPLNQVTLARSVRRALDEST